MKVYSEYYGNIGQEITGISIDGYTYSALDVVTDRLPRGHTILEQADMMDGRVSQTVQRPDKSEYERVVDADEAYYE